MHVPATPLTWQVGGGAPLELPPLELLLVEEPAIGPSGVELSTTSTSTSA
jgi:hypothetical protein